MIFTKLKLKNFKSYSNAIIDFETGINIIVGENGAGKSTILEAISFVLFKQHSGKKIDNLVRITKNKNSHETMSVSLEFNSNGNKYKIKRSRSSTSKAELLLKDEESYIRIASGDTSVNEEIQSIINMDADLFLNAIYIRQGEIANLIGKTPSEKKQLIGKLMGIEDLEKAWKNSLPLINIYENQKSELKGRVSSTSKLDEELKTKIVILDDLKIRATDFEKEFKDLERLKEKKEAEKFNIESEKVIFDKLNNNLLNETENIKKIIDDKKNFQTQLDEINKMEEEMQSLEKYVNKLPLYLNFQESVNNLKHLKKDEKYYEDKIASIKKQKEILKQERPLYEEYIQIQNKLNDFNERKSKIEGKLEVAKKLEEDRASLSEEINITKTKIDEFLDNSSKSLNIDIEDFEDFKEKLIEIKSELSDKLKEVTEEYKSKSQEVPRLEEGIKSAEKPLVELEQIDNQCPVCKSDISEDKKTELINSYNDTIKYNTEKVSKLKNGLKKLDTEMIVFENKLKDLQIIENDINKHESSLENIIKKNLEKIKELDNELNSKEETESKLKDILLLIDTQKKRQDITKENYDNYIHGEGSLDTLGKEHEARDKLREIIRNVDIEIEKIKEAISKDNYLSTQIEEEDLKSRIDDLMERNRRYNELKGSIKQKSIIESQIKSKNDDFDSIRSKIDNINHDIKASKYDEEIYKKILFIYERSQERLTELNKIMSEIKGKATEIIANIEELTKKLNENDVLKEKLENIDDYLRLLKEIRELYNKDGIQKELRNRSKPLIQKYTKEFFEQFNFNYSDLIIDEDYNVSVYGPEGETSLDMVSGGEKIAIALALRLGITRAMSKGNIETILLDEPTIHLDNYRRQELIDLLRKMAVLPQMIIVTHDAELENAADNIIKVLKQNGISELVLED
ncbi:putative DNA double-strand break repair Rad50 ATPase [Methanobrevibacter cuticularis]|uniref:DNA double-strand break repair Rad50 ATPase n=1 Tax=Methanobrevibacter cuticularis TaxID=47311 RepID=A0A166CXV6_9EURY|nr:AAA family ATPase [Methanobrevibacter cuticularis]KZX17507.1 putative DNA double-strand break repair Rad50 ATPase [Methanobrevibacter cuticularis]